MLLRTDYFSGLGDEQCTAWTSDRVRVMAVCPGRVDTNMGKVSASTARASSPDKMATPEPWYRGILSPEAVADAARNLILYGRPGEVVNVSPGKLHSTKIP